MVTEFTQQENQHSTYLRESCSRSDFQKRNWLCLPEFPSVWFFKRGLEIFPNTHSHSRPAMHYGTQASVCIAREAGKASDSEFVSSGTLLLVCIGLTVVDIEENRQARGSSTSIITICFWSVYIFPANIYNVKIHHEQNYSLRYILFHALIYQTHVVLKRNDAKKVAFVYKNEFLRLSEELLFGGGGGCVSKMCYGWG
jgi:hypothetical protein